MKPSPEIIFAVILAVCCGLATGTIKQNSSDTPSEESTLLTRSSYSSTSPSFKSFYALSSLASTFLSNSADSGTIFSPTPANASTYKPTATEVDAAKVPAQPTRNRGDICNFMFGHACRGFNLRRSSQGQVREDYGHPHSTVWVESISIETSLSYLSTGKVPGNIAPREGGIGATPSVSGAYGDHGPDVPDGGYGYPPPTTVTVPVANTTPVIVQTRVETVTISLSYIPPAPLPPPPTPSPLVNSTHSFPNITVPETSIPNSSQTTTTEEHTPTTRTESIFSTHSTTVVTPGSSSSTFTRHTTWSFESILHTVTPTPTPAIDTNAARSTTEANYPLLCSMIVLVLLGSTAHGIRVSSRADPTKDLASDLQGAESIDFESDDRCCYVKGFGDEEPDMQSKIEEFLAQYGKVKSVCLRRDLHGAPIFKGAVFVKWDNKGTAMNFVNYMPKPEYNERPLVMKWKLYYAGEKNEAIIGHQVLVSHQQYLVHT